MSIGLGVAIYAALKPVLKIYVIIFVGFLIAKYNIVTVETSRGVSNMVVNAILPCLTFNKIVSNISDKDIKEVGVLVFTAIILFVAGGLAAFFTKWATNAPKSWYWGLLFSGIFPNISDLPIAYVQSMSNGSIFTSDQVDRGVAYCCIFLASQSFLMMNFGMFRLVGLDFREKKEDEEDGPDSLHQFSQLEKDDKDNDVDGKFRKVHSSNGNNCGLNRGHDQAGTQGTDGASELDDLQSSLSESIADGEQSNTNQQDRSIPICDNSVSGTGVDEGSSISEQTIHSDSSFQPIHTLPSISMSLRRANSQKSENRRRSCSESTSSRRRRQRANSQSVNDVINEYSAVTRIKTGEIDLSQPLSLTQEVGASNTSVAATDEDCDDPNEPDAYEMRESNLGNLSIVSTAKSTLKGKSKFSKFVKKYRLGWFLYILINFCRPASLGTLLGIICSMIPWVKGLFVHTDVHMHQAPDGEPVLNFLMDFTSYIGDACVPLGLLLLGGTLARLKVKVLPKGFWKTAVMMTVFRLMVLPIIGFAWANKIYELNWLENEVAKFITILTWSMPSATAQVYFTAFYTPLEGDHLQMDCLSVLFLSQYLVLFITLSIVVTYALKVDLKV